MTRLTHSLVAVCMLLASVPAIAQSGGGATGFAGADVQTCGAFKQPKNDHEIFCLRGRVKAIRKESKGAARRGDGWVDGHTTSILVALFDERGNKTEQIIDNASSAPRGYTESRLVFSFDGGGRATGWKSYREGSPEPVDVHTYSYDDAGNRIKEETVHTDGSLHVVFSVAYDARRRKIRDGFDYLTGKGWTHTVAYTYDGDAVHHVIHNHDGTLAGKGARVHDDDGRFGSYEHYQFTAQGQPVLSRKVSYRYDGAGLLVESRYHKAEASLGARAVYEYDDKSNLISATRYKDDGSFAARELFRYEYDAHGNWVTLVRTIQYAEKDEPTPYLVERRTITYR